MEKLKAKVKDMVLQELQRANKNFPLFASHVEGYGVIKEEIEEAQEEIEAMVMDLDGVWRHIRNNSNPDSKIGDIYESAINAAAESIQVAAMCLKFEMSSVCSEEEYTTVRE